MYLVRRSHTICNWGNIKFLLAFLSIEDLLLGLRYSFPRFSDPKSLYLVFLPICCSFYDPPEQSATLRTIEGS